MRRFVTFLAVAAITAVGSLYWLHDGDLAEAIEPVVAEWDAEQLARNAGLLVEQLAETATDEVQDGSTDP